MDKQVGFGFNKQTVGLIFGIVILAIVLFSLSQVFDSVTSGTVVVKQAAITGTMSALYEEGIYICGYTCLKKVRAWVETLARF